MHQRNNNSNNNNNDVVIAVVVAAIAATVGIAYAVKQWKPIEITIGPPVRSKPPTVYTPVIPPQQTAPLRDPQLALEPAVQYQQAAPLADGKRYFNASNPTYVGVLR